MGNGLGMRALSKMVSNPMCSQLDIFNFLIIAILIISKFGMQHLWGKGGHKLYISGLLPHLHPMGLKGHGKHYQKKRPLFDSSLSF
jgi:hypothetical protein